MTEPIAVDQARIDSNWRAITIELEAPRPSRLERSLQFVRVPASVTRVVASTPAMRRSWYLSIVGVVLVGLGVADPTDRGSLFALLVSAPLLPVLGVAMAYGSASDPAHEMQLATPTHGLRLVTIRAATVLVISVAVVGLLTLPNEAARPYAAAWLLPALAVTTASLAVMTVRPPRQAAGVVASAWFVVVMAARVAADDPLAAFRAAGQATALAIVVGAVAVAVARRDRFEQLELAS